VLFVNLMFGLATTNTIIQKAVPFEESLRAFKANETHSRIANGYKRL